MVYREEKEEGTYASGLYVKVKHRQNLHFVSESNNQDIG